MNDANLAHEYQAVHAAAGLFDISDRGKIEVAGADAIAFLQNMCTNDVKRLTPGQGCEAFFLDAKGRILDHAWLFLDAESVWIDCAPGRSASLLNHLDRYVIREDVQLRDHAESLAVFHLAGPMSVPLLTNCGIDAADIPDPGIASATVDDCNLLLRRCDRSLLHGFDLVVAAEFAPALRKSLMNAGKTLGLEDASSDTLELLRIEAGIAAVGKEIGEENLVQELGRDDKAMSLTKGCYIGQETVARLDARGHVNKRLRGLVLQATERSVAGAALFHEEKQVGQIGGCAFSPSLGKPIALAVVRRPADAPGTQLSVNPTQETNEAITATVTALPFQL